VRGTNYGIGFGIAVFFLVGGIAMFLLGEELFPSGSAEQDIGGAGDTFRMIGAIWAGVALLLIVFFGAMRLRAAKRANIAATGIPGTATVKKADQTGVYVNYNPQYELTLELQSDGLAAGKQVERKAVVPMTALGRFGLGTELPIRIDKENPDDFEILWDELPAPGSQQAAQSGAEQRLDVLEQLRKEDKISSAEYDKKRQEILAEL
jgi:hypothetical protein